MQILINHGEARGKIELVPFVYGILIKVNGRSAALIDLFNPENIKTENGEIFTIAVLGHNGEVVARCCFSDKIEIHLDKDAEEIQEVPYHLFHLDR
jgi:hypothetical protein